MSDSKIYRETSAKAIDALTDSQKTLTKILSGNGTGIGLMEENRVNKANIDILLADKETLKSTKKEHTWAVVICVLSAIIGVFGQYIVSHLK
jgi:hypothetical protein